MDGEWFKRGLGHDDEEEGLEVSVYFYTDTHKLDDVWVLREGDQNLHLHHNVLSLGDRRGGGGG